MPIRRHALLISDNPSSAAPRRVVTSQDGTVDVRLRPGNYTVESDRPVAFDGRAYQWTQFVDVVAGRDAVLELTADNADPPDFTTASADSAAGEDASSLSSRWQDSVVGVWTPTAHASGFVIDPAGLVVTNRLGLAPETSVEVQFSPDLKVAATVVASDAERDVAVVRIDPARAAAVKPVPLECGESMPAPAVGEPIHAIEAPLRQLKGATSGTVSKVAANRIDSDIAAGAGGSGGPVFDAKGNVVGITSQGDGHIRQGRPDIRVVRMSEVCAVVELARTKASQAVPPHATPLPVEPARAYPAKALDEMVSLRAGNLNPYQTSSADFDIAFLTPVHVYAGQRRSMVPSREQRTPDAGWLLARLATDFGNWSDYVADVPPVLMIRVTPKLVESFWTKIARGAVLTQGVALPPIKRLKSGFWRMRVFCGDVEIVPIHPLVIEQAITDSETITEGLYVFDPGALPPACGSVRLSLSSQKDPEKADSRVVDPNVIQRVWDDFAPYRAQP